jgi:hypothetical protein
MVWARKAGTPYPLWGVLESRLSSAKARLSVIWRCPNTITKAVTAMSPRERRMLERRGADIAELLAGREE